MPVTLTPPPLGVGSSPSRPDDWPAHARSRGDLTEPSARAPATVVAHDGTLAPADGVATRHVGGAPGVDAARAALRPVLRRRHRAGGDAAPPRVSHGDAGYAVVSYAARVLRHLVGVDELHVVRVARTTTTTSSTGSLVFVQMAGVLILAAGVPRAFEHRDFDIVIARLRRHAGGAGHPVAARRPPRPGERRTTHCATPPGSSLCHGRLGRVSRCSAGRCGRSCVMGVAELVRPGVAERGGTPRRGTPSTSPSATACSRSSCWARRSSRRRSRSRPWSTRAPATSPRLLTAVGALLTVFSMWWIYFAKPAAPRLISNRVAFPWGYGHFVVFGSAAAVGAGVAVMVDRVTGRAHISGHRRRGGLHDPGDPLPRGGHVHPDPALRRVPRPPRRAAGRARLRGRGDVHGSAGAPHRARARGLVAVLLVQHERASH